MKPLKNLLIYRGDEIIEMDDYNIWVKVGFKQYIAAVYNGEVYVKCLT